MLAMPLADFTEPAANFLSHLLQSLFFIAGAWMTIESTDVVGDVVRGYFRIDVDDNLEERKIITQLHYVKRLVAVVATILALALILLQFEQVREIGTGLLASAGVAGIIIGFAAQKTLSNLLAGFLIAFTQPIRIDDVVVVEGEWGRIEEITLTYVVVRIWDERRLVLPLQYFIEKPFQNWTRTSADILAYVFLYTDYRLPVDPLRTELGRILRSTDLWDGRVNVLQVTDADRSTIEVRALMSASNSSRAWDLRCLVREQLVVFIQENYPECLPRTRVELPTGKAEDILN